MTRVIAKIPVLYRLNFHCFDEIPKPPGEVVWEAEQPVTYLVSFGCLDVDIQQRGWIGVKPDREAQALVEHELMEAFH